MQATSQFAGQDTRTAFTLEGVRNSVRTTLIRKLIVILGVWAVAATGVAVWSIARIVGVDPTSSTEQQIQHGRPAAPGSPAALIAAHHCWSGQAPADMTGKIPGHAVVAVGATPRYVGARLTGQALEQTFDGVDHGLVVYAFCR